MNLSASSIGRRSSSAVSWKSENHDDMGMALSAEWKIEIISRRVHYRNTLVITYEINSNVAIQNSMYSITFEE